VSGVDIIVSGKDLKMFIVLLQVPDSGGAPPGMDCMPLQRSAGPFHYLIHEQAKSLVALQVSKGLIENLSGYPVVG